MSSIKIAFFTPTLNTGGIERAYINLGIALQRAGCSVTYIVTRKEGAFLSLVENSNMHLVSLECKQLRHSFKKLRCYLNNNDFQFVISGPPYATLLCWLAKKTTRKRFKVFSYFHAFVNQDSKDDGFLGKMIPFIFKHIYPRTDIIIAVSQKLKDYAIKTFKTPINKTLCIPNLVLSSDFFDRAEASVEKNLQLPQRFVIALGRLSNVKCIDLLIQAFKEVCSIAPDVKLLLVGDGPEKEKLIDLSKKLSIAQSVIFLGDVTNPLPILSKASLLVSSSSSEGLPLGIIEALALQIPIVATKTPGAVEVLENGKYGRLVNIGDIQELQNAVIEQLNIGKRNINERWKDFSEANILEEYMSLFKKIGV